jgi:uncharacterized protein YbbC (DUF1343 family)
VYFTPSFSKHQGKLCGGIHLHIVDEKALRPVELGIRLLDLVRRMYPQDFKFLEPFREGGKPFISLLSGHRDFEDPAWDVEVLLNRARKDGLEFARSKAPYEIYPKENG